MEFIIETVRSDYQYSLCNVPAWVIGSREFNANPKPLSVHGVRTEHAHFFRQLDQLDSWEERARIFQDYMDVAFHLHQWRKNGEAGGTPGLKHSYLSFLRGWLFDADSVDGAVLKGWVESRMGLPPIYHGGRIKGKDSQEYLSYLTDRMNGAARTNGIFSQLDLLYEFVQYEIKRRDPDTTHITLFRGVHGFYDHDILEWDAKKGNGVIRLNNLNSFTHDFERAWEFGTFIIEAKVPVSKIFFDGAFLHAGILKGEEEVLVIGGVYDISRRII
ncbi:NAD(+)--dinitrogen-reductase ADP-D-ribosyltransferase [uncultured Desulfobacter sp.]|uniref:NAD(+)--dinitrogen-reductase ADP-D-ribosyltransferase n=1 Tax=uncultured Desulfobacter sp. TaxID=240139 RepID=UPI002AAAAA77|nr:NAD(+)--dinitrogen-reductase ADP-D-ribosyltransferase [uncultured Desulfobacter sp.]